MTKLFASKSDVLNPRYEAEDSIQLHNVTTVHRDTKDIQEVGDIVFNTDTDRMNLLTSTGWDEVLTSGGVITANAILLGGAGGSIDSDYPTLSYDKNFNRAVFNSVSPTIAGGKNTIIGGGDHTINGASALDCVIIGAEQVNFDNSCQRCFAIGSEIGMNAANDSIAIGSFINIEHDNVIIFNTSSSPVDSQKDGDILFKTDSYVGINTANPETTLHLNGGVAYGHRIFTPNPFGSTATPTTRNDYYIAIRTVAGLGTTVILSTADKIPGRKIVVYDQEGDALTGHITIITEDGSLISGNPSKVINFGHGGIEFTSNGANWFSFVHTIV